LNGKEVLCGAERRKGPTVSEKIKRSAERGEKLDSSTHQLPERENNVQGESSEVVGERRLRTMAKKRRQKRNPQPPYREGHGHGQWAPETRKIQMKRTGGRTKGVKKKHGSSFRDSGENGRVRI